MGHVTAEPQRRSTPSARAGGRIVAVGTTSLRLFESAAAEDGTLGAFSGETALFITPGYRFRAVDGMLTNFHLPRSTLFMLVSAFCGLDTMQRAYAHAIEQAIGFTRTAMPACCFAVRSPRLAILFVLDRARAADLGCNLRRAKVAHLSRSADARIEGIAGIDRHIAGSGHGYRRAFGLQRGGVEAAGAGHGNCQGVDLTGKSHVTGTADLHRQSVAVEVVCLNIAGTRNLDISQVGGGDPIDWSLALKLLPLAIPRFSTPSFTADVNSGNRLSSAVMLRLSVPVRSIRCCPCRPRGRR